MASTPNYIYLNVLLSVNAESKSLNPPIQTISKIEKIVLDYIENEAKDFKNYHIRSGTCGRAKTDIDAYNSIISDLKEAKKDMI